MNSKLLIATSAAALWGAAIYGQVAQSPAPASAQRPAAVASAQTPAPRVTPVSTRSVDAASQKAVMDKYCVTCHNARAKASAANLQLDTLDMSKLRDHAELVEKIVLKLRAGMMPPSGMPRPDAATMSTLLTLHVGE